MNSPSTPFVRVVVLNFDGGQMTLDCLDSLLASEWPADRLEIVLVDNGSLDDVAARVTTQYPTVRLLEPLANLGFAGGCNLGMRAPGHYDLVALVNNDATVRPDWLAPLVATVTSADGVGAACAKMLFADRFLGIDFAVATPTPTPTPTPTRQSQGTPVPRVQVTAVRIDGSRADSRLAFDEGFFATPPNGVDPDDEIVYSSPAGGSLRIAVVPGEPLPTTVELRLAAARPEAVTITSGAESRVVQLGSEPVWVAVALGGEPFDVINNTGSNLYRGGFGGDRGFLERDHGQYDAPAEVFAWCGGAVLLRRDYLDAVGMFDERLFLYYEDTDLSWRGRLHGWRYLYEPRSVVRHRHAASSQVGSDVFRFHTERNRLLVLAKNAPARIALRAGLGEARRWAQAMSSAWLWSPLRLRMPERSYSGHRARVFAGYLHLLPAMLLARWRMHPRVRRRTLTVWEVSK